MFDYKIILLELFDGIFSLIAIAFILAWFSFPWNILLMGILVLPFAIGCIRSIKSF